MSNPTHDTENAEILLGLVPLHEGQPYKDDPSHVLRYSFFAQGKLLDESSYFVRPEKDDFLEKIPKLGQRIRLITKKVCCSSLLIHNGIARDGFKDRKHGRKIVQEINSEILAHFFATHLPKFTSDHAVIYVDRR
jgi:hypothetical protein